MKINGHEFYSGFEYGNKDGKSGILEKGGPFLFQHEQAPDTIVVCVHGYTATPYESKPVGEKVFELGMDAVGPLMVAHGIKNRKKAIESMNQVRWSDWVQCLQQEIAQARKHYDNVYIYGQSMGGALSLIMAEEGLVDAVALTAPAIKLPPYAMMLWVLGWIPITVPDNSAEKREFFNVSYDFNNLRSLLELFRMGRFARKNLHKITVPVLECHSEQDEIITPKVAKMIEKNVSGPVEVRWFNDSLHTMPLHVRGEEVSETIADFFVRQ